MTRYKLPFTPSFPVPFLRECVSCRWADPFNSWQCGACPTFEDDENNCSSHFYHRYFYSVFVDDDEIDYDYIKRVLMGHYLSERAQNILEV